MTTIRPNLSPPLPGAAPSTGAASARAAFFQAMNGTAAAPVAAAASVQRTVSAPAAPAQAAPASPPDPARPLRPGSLLDIRV